MLFFLFGLLQIDSNFFTNLSTTCALRYITLALVNVLSMLFSCVRCNYSDWSTSCSVWTLNNMWSLLCLSMWWKVGGGTSPASIVTDHRHQQVSHFSFISFVLLTSTQIRGKKTILIELLITILCESRLESRRSFAIRRSRNAVKATFWGRIV